MRLRYVLPCALLWGVGELAMAGPYAPAAGQPGSTAMDKADPSFVAWASGHQNYLVGTDADTSWQTPGKALGPAVGNSFDIVSLGNGGRITLTFDQPITDGAGADFAVFENAVTDTFLELAFVEVSSDGVNFFRFVNDSLTASAVGAFGIVDPTDIDGFAGKYRQGFGTPFDLTLLDGTPGLNIQAVTHVRLIDVLGNGSETDSSGSTLYDPYKTVGSAGFDLDAVGVIHEVPEPASLLLMTVAVPFIFVRRHSHHTHL
ncbi:MAG: PEP-CTERM sorting domain-containing protein [Phycisphaerales bacterium]